MQSWGTTSRFDQRDTGKEPSKSGVIGLLAAAMGIDRQNWKGDLEPLTRLAMGVRHDRAGVLKYDFQTAGCADNDSVIRANGTPSDDGIVSQRYYLADAAFLVALEGSDKSLMEAVHGKLKNPTWPIFLGRKSYPPAEPVWVKDGIKETPLLETLKLFPWLSTLRRWEEKPPEQLLVSMDSDDGTGVLKIDQPLSSFAERRFGARFVRSEWIPFPGEVANVSE
jgi:CRISPR system Cascade subunit CasD